MQFTQKEINAFRDASSDHNPLHLDEAYAKRTPYGQPIVYGMAVVLMALKGLAKGQTISTLSVEFKRPIYLHTEYDLKIRDTPKHTVLTIFRGEVPQVVIRLTTGSPSKSPHFGSEVEAYHVEPDSIKALESQFQCLFEPQLLALLWSSYFIGMKYPGRQALFSKAHFVFYESDTSTMLSIHSLTKSFDERFELATIQGITSGFSFELSAFQRPEPMTRSRALVNPDIGDTFEGSRVFITGSSRGLGLALADAFEAHGARAIRHGTGQTHVGDLTIAESCLRIREELNGAIDILVLNAFPSIRPLYFNEQTSEDFLGFVNSTMSMTLNTLKYFLPLVPPGGMVLHLSTQFLDKPKSQFSHYLSAKGAAEGLIKALSMEHPQISFLNLRLGRIATDQTRGVGTGSLQDSAEAAKEILEFTASEFRKISKILPLEGSIHY